MKQSLQPLLVRFRMRTELLEELTGMSAASLLRNFRALAGMSPLQYQKQIRLHEARTRLVSREGEVAAVGSSLMTLR
jgi:AraC-like DNA-binding protein